MIQIKNLSYNILKVVARTTVGKTENNTFNFVRRFACLYTTISRITGHHICKILKGIAMFSAVLHEECQALLAHSYLSSAAQLCMGNTAATAATAYLSPL